MVKPLSFKGEKKPKKRKHAKIEEDDTATSAPVVAEADADEDDSWVTAETPADVTGPVVIVVPTTLPMCIACDATGKVFLSQIENIVDDNPTTAEPHDVRQVWIANRVAGTECLSLKGHHGR